jgi:hypothetical protein
LGCSNQRGRYEQDVSCMGDEKNIDI